MQVTEYALFPTRLLAIQFPDTAELNREIEAVFATRPEFRGDFDMHPGSLNLLRLAGECPCLAVVRGMLLDGVRRWLRAAGVRGELAADVVLFSNIAERVET